MSHSLRCTYPACNAPGGAIVASLASSGLALDADVRFFKRAGMATCAACRKRAFSDPDSARVAANIAALSASGYTWQAGGVPKPGQAPQSVTVAPVVVAPVVVAAPAAPAAPAARPPKPGKPAAVVGNGASAAPIVASPAPAVVTFPAPIVAVDPLYAAIDAAADSIADAIAARFAARIAARVKPAAGAAIAAALAELRTVGGVQ